MTQPPEQPAEHDPDAAGSPSYRVGPGPRGCRCCLLVLGGVMFFIAPFAVVTAFILTMSGGPDDSARDWLTAVRQGRYDAAVHQMCARYRDTLTPADLARRVAAAGGVRAEQIGRTTTRSSSAASVLATVTGTDRHSHQVRLSMTKEDGLWRVCSLP